MSMWSFKQIFVQAAYESIHSNAEKRHFLLLDIRIDGADGERIFFAIIKMERMILVFLFVLLWWKSDIYLTK